MPRRLRWSAFERRQVDALLSAILPPPDHAKIGWREIDLDPFWAGFGAAAPIHLRLGLRAAVWTLAVGWPAAATDDRRSLADRAPAEQRALIERAAQRPPLAELLELLKVVAALAFFDDDRVQAAVRMTCDEQAARR